MIPIRVFIPVKALDAYIYSGHIFAVFEDGTLRSLPLMDVYQCTVNQCPDVSHILKLALLRNDWLSNQQALTYFRFEEALREIKRAWSSCAKSQFIIDQNDPGLRWKHLWEIPSMPIYDMKMYAMRVYLAHRKGIHEGSVSFKNDEIKTPTNDLSSIFDARTIFISVRSGELMFSADSEGLFHGTLWNDNHVTKVTERPYAKKSLRTGWSGFDVLNYDSHSHFSYMKNETQKVDDRTFAYSQQDELAEKRKITHFATSSHDMDDMTTGHDISKDEVQYSYNSSKTCFFILKDGRLVTRNFIKSTAFDTRLSSRASELSSLKEAHIGSLGSSKLYSVSIFPSGSVMELFDGVLLLYDNKFTAIEDKPAISVRTFPSSIRYRRIISTTREDGISLTSIFPSDWDIKANQIY